MSIFFYIAGYILVSIGIAYFLKSRKSKVKEIKKYSKAKQIENKIFDRRKHNDYLNDPKFSYMSCNKHNPQSSFYKEKQNYSIRRKKRYVLVEESEYERIRNFNNTAENERVSELSKALMGYDNKYYVPYH